MTCLQNHCIKRLHTGTCPETKTLNIFYVHWCLADVTNKKNRWQLAWFQYRYLGAGKKEVLTELELIGNLPENAPWKNNLFNLPPTFIGYLSLLKKCQIIWVITISESSEMSFPDSSSNLLLTSICHLTCIWSISQFIK